MTDEDIKDRQLNAIVGAAVRALAENGVDDETVGAFAANHRNKVATILGYPEQALQAPDLQTIIQQAVIQALEQIGTGKRRSAGKTTQRFNVEIAGQRTSITLQKTTVAKLTESKGNPKAVSTLVRQLALDVPLETENNSRWIEDRIEAILRFEAQSAGEQLSVRH